MYYLLTERFKSQEALITDIICRKVDPMRLYFLGSTLSQERSESIFMPDAPSRICVGHYYLFVTINNPTRKTSYYQDIIENSCSHLVPVTAIVLSEKFFLNLVNTRNFFSSMVKQRAVSLFSHPHAINIKTITTDYESSISIAEEKRDVIDGFLSGAEFFIDSNQKKCALFLLHQSIEQILHNLLLQYTGLNFNTHNLDKLIRYSCMIDYKIRAIFSNEKLSDRNLLRLVTNSYYEARYNSRFDVSKKDITKIYQKAKSLRDLFYDKKEAII